VLVIIMFGIGNDQKYPFFTMTINNGSYYMIYKWVSIHAHGARNADDPIIGMIDLRKYAIPRIEKHAIRVAIVAAQ
jgi:hypothetical protein